LLLTGLLSRGGNSLEQSEKERQEVEKLQHHVNALEVSMRHGKEARIREAEREHKEEEAKEQIRQTKAKQLGIDGQLIQRRETMMERERRRDANRVRHQFHMNDFDVFHQRGTAQMSSTLSPAALLGPYQLRSAPYTFGRTASVVKTNRSVAKDSSGRTNNSSKSKNRGHKVKDISGRTIGVQKSSGKGKSSGMDFGLSKSRTEINSQQNNNFSDSAPALSVAAPAPALTSTTMPPPAHAHAEGSNNRLKTSGEILVYSYGPGSPFPRNSAGESSAANFRASTGPKSVRKRFVESMGSSKGVVPNALKDPIKRHHEYAKLDVTLSDDIRRNMAKGDPPPRFLRAQYGKSSRAKPKCRCKRSNLVYGALCSDRQRTQPCPSRMTSPAAANHPFIRSHSCVIC
jgi:hypothetical protein